MTGAAADPFERGVDAFNRRAYLESSEIWEELWRDAQDPEKRFLAAMIQVAAALHLRFERGGGRGARNLVVQALLGLEDFRPAYRAIDVERFHAELATFAERLEERKERDAGWLDRWIAPRIRAA